MNKVPAVRPIDPSALLAGSRVVEISASVGGAYCGLVLARLGAHVARCEGETSIVATPATGREMQRVFHGSKEVLRNGDDEALDSALAAARIVIVESLAPGHPLAARAQALIENRSGLAADAIVVVLSAHGAGEDLADGGCGLTSAAGSGLSFAIGNRGEEPLTLPYDIADYENGINGASAAIAGLLRGHADGGMIDVASRDVLANLVGTLAQNYVPYGRPWRREGTRPSLSGGVYPCGLFPCEDGYVAVYCRGTSEWRGIVNAMGNPDWSQEERFLDPKVVATHHADEADSHLMPWLGQYTRQQLMALGFKFGFPVAPVRYVREALADEQFAFRGSFDVLAGVDGRTPLKVPAAPWRLYEIDSARPSQTRAPVWAKPAAAARPPAQILRGLRVLDFTWVWSGPLVASVLADLGAEVIKVEHPSRPDSLRMRGRSLRDGVEIDGPAAELNPWFNQLNHGKKSIVADIKSEHDRARLRRLAATCDVVVENMRPGALAESGLGYEDLAAVNPGLVMLSMSMAGQSGPLSKMKGYAGIMTSMAGLESLVGYPSDAADAPFIGMTMTALGDPNGAAHGVAVLLAALHRRRESGRGAWIDLAQTDAILAIMAAPIVESQVNGHVPVRGNEHPDYFPHGHFPARGEDRWIALSVRSDAQWQRFAQAAGGVFESFSGLDLAGRKARRAEIEQALRTWTSSRTQEQTVAVLRPLAIPCAPVATYEEMMASEWKSQRGISREVDHPYLGRQEVFVVPWQFGGRTAGVAAPAPLLGQHSAEILGPHSAPTNEAVPVAATAASTVSATK